MDQLDLGNAIAMPPGMGYDDSGGASDVGAGLAQAGVPQGVRPPAPAAQLDLQPLPLIAVNLAGGGGEVPEANPEGRAEEPPAKFARRSAGLTAMMRQNKLVKKQKAQIDNLQGELD